MAYDTIQGFYISSFVLILNSWTLLIFFFFFGPYGYTAGSASMGIMSTFQEEGKTRGKDTFQVLCLILSEKKNIFVILT